MNKIHDITEKRGGDFCRFSVIDLKNGRFTLHMEKKDWKEKWGDHLIIEMSTKRLIRLANEILSYLKQEAKIEEWHPTLEEIRWKIEQECGKGNYSIENWFLDWVRISVTMERKEEIKQFRRIYEWLKSNEDWLYGRGR